MKRVKYLNNKDLLKQIHLSKNTYCSYVSDDDAYFDIIVPKVTKINATTIAQARKNKAKKLTQIAWEQAKEEGQKKIKLADFTVSPRSIEKTDLVFRVMTFDHVPLDDKRKKNPKQTADHHSKCNFPPFQHYRIGIKGKPKCVGKSHWVGGMDNGYWSIDHGNITNSLAMMFMKLCERYGTRSNWRGYTYNDEMRSQALMQLSQIGLQFDESKSENPFAYYTAAITNSFTRILNLEKRNQNIRDDILEDNGMNPSFTRQSNNEMGTATFKAKANSHGKTVKVATKSSMAEFNKNYKKTGKMDYSILKYKDVTSETLKQKQEERAAELEKENPTGKKGKK